jgi:hypothetical protein
MYKLVTLHALLRTKLTSQLFTSVAVPIIIIIQILNPIEHLSFHKCKIHYCSEKYILKNILVYTT